MRPLSYHSFRSILLLSTLLLGGAGQALTQDTAPIQQWIDEATQKGGGVVSIPPGEHLLPRGLTIKGAKKLALRGLEKERCILRLPPLAYAVCAQATPAGATSLPVKDARQWQPGMRLHIETDGELDSFTKKPRPFVLAHIQSIEPGHFILKEPLKFPVPAGTVIRHEDAPNLIEVRDSETIEIANLTLDGGRLETDPPVQGHAQLCAIFASGRYSYEKGPTGPPVKDLTVRDCIIQNCFGRGVAFYSVIDSSVERCSLRDCNDEAIDLDHFTVSCIVRGNQIARCRIGVEMNDTSKALVEGNEIRHPLIGISLWRWCKQPGLNEDNIIRNNLISHSAGNGIQVGTGTTKNLFESNTIEASARNGISLSGTAQTLRANTITSSQLKPIAINEGQHQIDPAP